MNKEQLLQELSLKIANGEIRWEEIEDQLVLSQKMAGVETTTTGEKTSSHFSLNKMLYALGGVVVIIGIIIFMTQIWDDIGSGKRIVGTLGLGILIAGLGSVLLIVKPENTLGQIFHCLGGVLIPGGAVVMLQELLGNVHPWPTVLTFAVIFAVYLILTIIHRKPVLTFFLIANGTACVYLFVAALFENIDHRTYADIYAYLTIIMGGSYLLLAQAFKNSWNEKLMSVLNFFGTLGILGGAWSRVFDSDFWKLFYFVLVAGGFYLSARIRSRGVLILSTLFLIAHVIYITGKYFADSLGWPISLVILGFVLIGLGYASITFSKRYIQ